MEQYKVVSEGDEFTVASDFEPHYNKKTAYQSEAELEKTFIHQLQEQAYEYLSIKTEADLIINLRNQLEKLNKVQFTDSEWERFFNDCIANRNAGIVEKTEIIQEKPVQVMYRDDGSFKNIMLIDKASIHNNTLQVINQYVPEGGTYDNRYDVTVLVNGLPLVHIELKRRGVDIREAFNQIDRYNRDSFWAGSGLFEYVQLFVISNGTTTKYYSNTTRASHIAEYTKQKKSTGGKQTSNSYEFTSYWANMKNKVILDLEDFTSTFFSKKTLLNIITKYCVFTSERLLLVMRPYQIAATEAILSKIRVSTNYKKYGNIDGGGYVWHTTGSGKTLTSFKAARLISGMEGIDKVLFVVDRKDLDYQTMKEYDRFEKGAANSNKSTSVLKRQLEDSKCNIIITTIQKLSIFVSKNPSHEVYNRHVVLIFDECHRSQFGDMHDAITHKFKKYHLFGFTGTPIFAINSSGSGNFNMQTTEQAFGSSLHTYTIVDAIADGNVLPFRVEYISTMREEENIIDEQVAGIDREKALSSPQRVSKIVEYILQHFDQKTKRNSPYKIKDKRVTGFNSIFATASIPMAKAYYSEFKNQMAGLIPDKRLKVAVIFSYGANEAVDDGTGLPDGENSDDTSRLDASSRDFLESAIIDYNIMFGTNYDTSSDKFQNYYKDVSMRMKNRDLDLLIVVNMFLTGFDATTLNTLWVDKNLRMHGLLQSYSRTNRILNSIKTFGNIVCFRNLEKATNDSISLFGDREACGIVLLRTYSDYYFGYINDKDEKVKGYKEYVDSLLQDFPLSTRIVGEQREKKFISLYGTILRCTNILSSFDDFEGQHILSDREVQDYHSIYLDLYDKFRKAHKGDNVNVNDDIVFEMELIKMVEINIDYILELIKKYHKDNIKDSDIELIEKAVNSSTELRNKKELIDTFIKSLTPESVVDDDWNSFVRKQEKIQLDKIVEDENLKPEQTYKYITNAFRDGELQVTGTAIAEILPPVSRFSKDGARSQKRETVIEKLKNFFDKFWDISGGKFLG